MCYPLDVGQVTDPAALKVRKIIRVRREHRPATRSIE